MAPTVLSPAFSKVPPEARQEYLRTAFTLFDEEAIGALDLTQLLNCLKAAGIDMSRRQAVNILRELRLGSDGVVDLPRFFKFITIASRSTEVASQFKANQEISATKKKIVNIYVVVLFFLTFGLTLIYISTDSKSNVLLVGTIFLAVLLVISVTYVIVIPLVVLKLKRQRAQVVADTAEERFVVFRENKDAVDLERQEEDERYSVSAIEDEAESLSGARVGSYRNPRLPHVAVPRLEDVRDGQTVHVQGDNERIHTGSGDDALALVPVESPTSPTSPSMRSSFNPLRAARRHA